MAVLAAVGTMGATAQAEAARYYFRDAEPGYARFEPAVMHPRHRTGRRQARKEKTSEKEAAKPQGPLFIAISINKQNLRIYDANGFFAETPISTGMRGHPTPTGVFSVIQKQKFHRSNIYSGAPMPFMQRITWSGVAMHAGVLPGYPASHGCIRMPMAFAVKMYSWTKMGARVVVTPGEITPPASFAHPLLVAQKVAPPVAATEPKSDTPATGKSDKAADAGTTTNSQTSGLATPEAKLELRSSVGHGENTQAGMDTPPAWPSLREQTHTADASHSDTITTSDAGPATVPSPSPHAAPGSDTGRSEATSEAIKSQADESGTARTGIAGSGDSFRPETAKAEIKPEDDAATRTTGQKSNDAESRAQTSSKTARSEPAADETGKPATEAKQGIADPKDQTRLPDTDKAAVKKPDPAAQAAPKRSGQISVFVSRKDSKLYVRQNFAPLFETPITIAPSDRPLGTHVFTAQVDKNDENVVRWSVVTLPTRNAERHDEDERSTRRRKIAGAVEVKPVPEPDSPTEALDRLTLPADVMARITEALWTGSSIIIADQGITAGETGEGTDFIVSLR